MRGSVFQRIPGKGRPWTLVVDVGRDLRTGRRKQQWKGGFKTRREAEEALSRLTTSLHDGSHVKPTRQTLAGYLEEWLKGLPMTDIAASTLDSYERNIRSHVIPRVGSISLQKLTATRIEVLYAELLENGRLDGRGGLSRRSVHYISTILHRALREAVEKNLLVRNPTDVARTVLKRARTTREIRTWSQEELRAFLRGMVDDRLYPVFLLAATTAMRRGEVLGLRWKDLNLDEGIVSVNRELISVRYELRFEERTKTGRGRTVEIHPGTTSALRSHRKAQLEEKLALGGAYQDDGLVFSQANGKPLHPDFVSKAFKRRARALDLMVIRFHDLRHTWATLALKAGVPVKIVSERLGHSSVAITYDVYSHVVPGMQRDAAQLVARAILGGDAST